MTSEKNAGVNTKLVSVVNYKNFGERIKAWANGKEPLPKSIEEFAKQLAIADVGAEIPSSVKRVIFVQDDEDTIVMRLPAKHLLEAAERRFLQEGGSYPLPAFYERAFGAEPDVTDKRAFLLSRVADYTVAQCD